MSNADTPHIIPLRVYIGIGAALLVLTVTTVAVSMIDLGFLNIVVALAIATFKALLVAFFFMHLYYDNKLYFFAFTTSIFFLTVFIMMTLFDTLRRGDLYQYRSDPIQKESALYEGRQSEESSGENH